MNLHFSVYALAYGCAALLSFTFAVTLSLHYRRINIGKSLCLAAYFNALCLAGVAFLDPINKVVNINTDINNNINLQLLVFIELLNYCIWTFALTKTAQRFCNNCIPKTIRISTYITTFLIAVLLTLNLRYNFAGTYALKVLVWGGVLFSILNLLILEQLYRNMTHDRLLRLTCLSLGLIFLFEAFLFSQNIVVESFSPNLWQIRASVILVAFILMSIGVLTLQNQPSGKASISFSQPAIFYTTSLTISGAVLIFLAVGGSYVKVNDGSWLTVVYSSLATVGIIAIALTFASDQIRRKINVFINKHLFSYKYDYRNEWLKLIRLLSQPTEYSESASRAIIASADLFRCDGGALWQKRGSVFVSTGRLGNFPAEYIYEEPCSTKFAKVLHSGWIFTPYTNDPEMAQNNDVLPGWIKKIPDIWLIFPLLVEDDINGFMILTQARDNELPNWEDLDLVKTVGRQVANNIARHEQSELLAQARQFETFNKLSAFVMHDLKNLIAQQSLVVTNAEKHKDNPAFVDDAINTIKNSVDRMNILLRKLRQNEPEETKVLSVKELLIEAVKRCQKTQPAPTLLHINEDIHVKADFDSLVMVFTHLIHNAQDATPVGGYIDIYLEDHENLAVICIEDNGEGMTEEFIRTKLFQPFESTKAGKGMGVGVYQAREYIENLGGEISVVSNPQQGSKFTLRIPKAKA